MTRRPSMISLLALSGLLVTGVAACSRSDPAAPADATPAAETTTVDAAPADASMTDASAPSVSGVPSGAAADQADGGGRGQGRGSGQGRGMDGPMTRASMSARSDDRFARMDADNDGVVTTAELQAAESDGRGGRGGRGLPRADANNDGRITRAEARAAATERFDRMDTNHDGVIGEDERPNWGGGRHGDGRGLGGPGPSN